MYPVDPALPQPNPSDPTTDSDGSATGALALDVDPQILEALRSKDRIYVLKLGESFESLITERRYAFHPVGPPTVLAIVALVSLFFL